MVNYLTRTQKMELSSLLKKTQEFLLREDEERETFNLDYNDLERYRRILLHRKEITPDEAESMYEIRKWILRGRI